MGSVQTWSQLRLLLNPFFVLFHSDNASQCLHCRISQPKMALKCKPFSTFLHRTVLRIVLHCVHSLIVLELSSCTYRLAMCQTSHCYKQHIVTMCQTSHCYIVHTA